MFPEACRYLLLLATVVSAAAKTLPSGLSIGATTNVTIESSGIDRTYLISIPPKFDAGNDTPVIFSFHGGSKNASEQQELSQFSNSEFNDFAIAIYPQGINVRLVPVSLATWQGVPGSSANDLQFVTDILDQLEQQFSIDTARVWASGKSDGGGFTNTLACDATLSARLAAFAPVSGAFYIAGSGCDPATVTMPCTPARTQIPVLEFHGLKDTTIDYEGDADRKSACLPAIPHWAQAWAVRDGLASTNVTSDLTADTKVYSFGAGDDEGLVTQVTDSKLAHDWPSTVPVGDKETASFNATPIIIEFFQKYTLPS
ncbi:Feruloyl esterase B [Lachnellula willkommii]|uniref:feruloyl esterase n=1 Tax=Lachnellula willkommii TaxID=215461 RepID=A0A559M3T5_9HELO|nr:Feruloyl esterase B [Lachnellula willkommii]